MSSGSSADAKELVRQAVDIVELVGEYLPLRREGRVYKARCPWHDDTRPSLTVNPERQVYRCWVCNLGGDIFSFIMKQEGVSFPEAMQLLADKANISLPSRSGMSSDVADQRRLYYQAMAWVEQQYHDHLLSAPEAEPARRYLVDRGITPESVVDWHLGAAPDRWEWIAAQAAGTRFTPQILEQIGVCGPRRTGPGHYDRFKGRVLFSIRDPQARPVALGGRILPGVDADAAKYINSPETPLFSKSSLLYGLDHAKESFAKSRTALVMEGYTDVLIAHQFGFRNAVAVLGTALGERHLRLLRRFVDKIVLVLDGDDAGRRRADEVLELFVAADMDLQILTLPDDLDPADFLLERGAEALTLALEGTVDALEHKFRTVTQSLTGQSTIHAIQRAVEQIVSTLAKAPGGADMSSAAQLKEEQIVNRLAHRAGVSGETLRRRILELRRSGNKSAPAPLALPPISTRREKAERWLLEILLARPDLVREVAQHVRIDQFQCPFRRRLFTMMVELLEVGAEPTFERLLLEFDEADMKNLLVDLDEEHRAINRGGAEKELRDLLDWFRQEDENDSPAPRIDQSAGGESNLAALQKLIERKRSGRGMTSTTDG